MELVWRIGAHHTPRNEPSRAKLRYLRGMWGLLVFSPIFASYVEKPLGHVLGPIPIIGALFSGPPIGIGLLIAGIILAIMIIPYVAAVMRDVFEVTPVLLKDVAHVAHGE